jgi:hypothetical protein
MQTSAQGTPPAWGSRTIACMMAWPARSWGIWFAPKVQYLNEARPPSATITTLLTLKYVKLQPVLSLTRVSELLKSSKHRHALWECVHTCLHACSGLSTTQGPSDTTHLVHTWKLHPTVEGEKQSCGRVAHRYCSAHRPAHQN